MKKVKYSVVIPVYNSEATLQKISVAVHAVFTRLKFDYELLFVDDCSPNQNTWPALLDVAKKNRKVKLVQLTRNFGQHAATLCGLAHASGDFIITMDDDLQHQPEDIPLLIDALGEADIVIAALHEKKHGLFKRMLSSVKQWFDYQLIGKPYDLQMSAFRLLRREIASAMLVIRTSYPFLPALMFYVTKNVKNVRVLHQSRLEGKSGYSMRKLLKLFSNLIINNSSFLLRLVGYYGVAIAFGSLLYGSFLVYNKLFFDSAFHGWTSLMVLLSFFGGMIMFTLGIMGEYLIRIIAGTENRPAYVVRKVV